MSLKTSLDMVVSNWAKTIPELQISPMEFYAKLTREIEAMNIPNAQVSRVWWKEAPLVGAQREYLRVERHRCVFDICCAPFGKGSFVSMWLCIVPFCISLTHIAGMALLAVLGYVLGSREIGGELMSHLGVVGLIGMAFFPMLAGIAVLSLLLHLPLWWVISRRMGAFVTLDSTPGVDLLIGMTLIGPVIIAWASRRPTYYQIDSASVFWAAVEGTTLEVLDGYFKEQNIRPLTELERKPVMREFMKRK